MQVWGGTPQRGPGAAPLAFLLIACALALTMLAWFGPGLLDWGRYRAGIAALAAAELRRPVSIGGAVHLALLPQPELTAGGVVLADRGDGISARIGAMRLQVALWPLLRGRLAVLRLTLDDPVINVPWPLPRAAVGGVPAVAQGFAAHVAGGTLHLGGVTVSAIEADMHADPDTGAFSAAGTAAPGGQPVHFDAVIGAPGFDGVATLSLSVDGQRAVQGAGASFHGRILANGAVEGLLRAAGPDASLLGPAPAVPWRVQGPVQAAASVLHAVNVQVMLGDSPGTAGATLSLRPPVRLEAGVRLGQVAAGPWLKQAAGLRSGFPVHLDLSAAGLAIPGGMARDPHAALLIGLADTQVEVIEATLPGDAGLRLSGSLRPGGFTGPLDLRVPDPAGTLAWLRGVVPGWPDLPPPEAPAVLHGDLVLGPARFELTSLHAEAGARSIDGMLAYAGGSRPTLASSLATDTLEGADWLTAAVAKQGMAWAALAQADITLQARVAHWKLPWMTLDDVHLSGRGDGGGLAVTDAGARLPGAVLHLAGALAPDDSVRSGTLTLDAADAAALPAAWRRVPGLWHGPLHLALTAEGPAQAIAVQGRCDLGDMRVETEATIDARAPALTAIATLRHPGAPRLLAQAGVPDAGTWLDQGSVAVLAHLTAQPGRVEVTDFSVGAAAVRLGGHGVLDFSGAVPDLSGRLDAPSLALPALDPGGDAMLPVGLLSGWQGRWHIKAARLLSGLRQVATGLEADAVVGGGGAMAGFAAHAASGALQGDLAIDASGAAPVVALRGALRDAEVPSAPAWRWSAGQLDVSADLTAQGNGLSALRASLSGTLGGVLHGASLQGIDLPRLRSLLAADGANLRPAVMSALSSGDTGPLTGPFTGSLDHGDSTVAADLAAPSGHLRMSGTIDLPARTQDISIRVLPDLPAALTPGVHLTGGWQQPKRVVDLPGALAAPQRKAGKR